MAQTISQERLTGVLFDVLEEVFDTHHGVFLDQDTALLPTLETVSAGEASKRVGDKCASLAAQTAHLIFYLEVIESYIMKEDRGPADWGEVWRTVEKVTPQEWDDLRLRLEQTYRRVFGRLKGFTAWDDETTIGGALGIAVHTAYHLGEIRQALCTFNVRRAAGECCRG